MGFYSKLNKFAIMVLASIVSFWFMMLVILPHINRNQSSRLLQLNKMEIFNETTLFKIRPIHINKLNSAFNQSSLQLLQIVTNNQIPRIIGQGVMIITTQWSHINYNHFIQPILKEYKKNHELSFYLIKQHNNNNYLKHSTLKQHIEYMKYLIQQCIEIKNIKKLTILSYEQGALISLLTLSKTTIDILLKIDKIILINTFSVNHQLYQNHFKYLAKEIKENIIKDDNKKYIFQNLRIIMINTFKTFFAEDQNLKKLFDFTFQDDNGVSYQLNNTLVLSSKAFWNINSFVRKGIYFHHASFLTLVSTLIIQDYQQKFTISQIEYLFRYGQIPARQQPNIRVKQLASKCKAISLQQLQGGRAQLQHGCYRILIRQRYKYDEAILILYSHERLQVYDQNGIKIHNSKAISQGNIFSNFITNLKQINQLIVITQYRNLNIRLSIIRSPHLNPLFQIKNNKQLKNYNVSAIKDIFLFQSCQGWRPLIGLQQNQKIKQLIEVQKYNCYIQIQQDNVNAQWYLYNWQLMRNMVIFSLFCSYIFKKKTINHYYLQYIIITMLIYLFLDKLYLIQTLIVLSFAILIQSLSKVLIKISQEFNITGFNYWFTIIFPLISQITGKVKLGQLQFNKSSNKLLWIQVSMINHQSGYIITLIKCYLMQDYYDTDHSCVYPLILLILWQLWNTPVVYMKFSTPLAENKKKLADMIYLFIFCLNLVEEATFPEIIDYYILTHLLLGLGEIVNTLTIHSVHLQ